MIRRQRTIFTTSWDDGHLLDARVAELLSLHGFRGTFYVPLANREGLPVMSPEELRCLGQGFEIGSHTVDHCYLPTVDAAEARRQVTEGKDRIEQILGRSVAGFSYPGGRYTPRHRQVVIEAGFEYARTNVSFHRAPSADPFDMPTTVQHYPHPRYVLVRHFFRRGEWRRRAGLLGVSLWQRDLAGRLRAMLDHVCSHGGVFHLWGHSWELGAFDGWRHLDGFLRYAGDRIPPEDRITNRDVLRQRAIGIPGWSPFARRPC